MASTSSISFPSPLRLVLDCEGQFPIPNPSLLSGDWPLKSLTRLIGPTYSPIIPYLIYSFQFFIDSSVVTLALHLVKLPLQG